MVRLVIKGKVIELISVLHYLWKKAMLFTTIVKMAKITLFTSEKTILTSLLSSARTFPKTTMLLPLYSKERNENFQ